MPAIYMTVRSLDRHLVIPRTPSTSTPVVDRLSQESKGLERVLAGPVSHDDLGCVQILPSGSVQPQPFPLGIIRASNVTVRGWRGRIGVGVEDDGALEVTTCRDRAGDLVGSVGSTGDDRRDSGGGESGQGGPRLKSVVALRDSALKMQRATVQHPVLIVVEGDVHFRDITTVKPTEGVEGDGGHGLRQVQNMLAPEDASLDVLPLTDHDRHIIPSDVDLIVPSPDDNRITGRTRGRTLRGLRRGISRTGYKNKS
jgi:hypothetical protein